MRARTLLTALLATALCLLALAGVLVDAPAAASPSCTHTAAPGSDLQEALDRLPASQARVTLCLGPGEFRLSHFLSIQRDGVTVRGEGSGTVLRLRDGLQSPLVVIGDYGQQVPSRPISDVTLERLQLIGNGGAAEEFQPDHSYLSNSTVVVRAGRTIALRDLDVRACRSACLLTEYDTQDVVIERSTISGSTWDGISLNRTARARLVGNIIRGNTAAGITTEHLEDSLIAHNVIVENRSHGIYLADSYRNVIADDRFADNVDAGVFLTCAIRARDPEPVSCWDDSMSQANRFERNEFVGNRRAFIVAANLTANCTKPGFLPNLSRNDRLPPGQVVDQRRDVFGPCLEGASRKVGAQLARKALLPG